jgi:hypothetical protein
VTVALALALALVLTAVAAAHFYWAFGGLWPASDEAGLINTVVGDRQATRSPPPWLTVVVAVAIEAAAVVSTLLTLHFGNAMDATVTLAGALLSVTFLTRFSFGYLEFWRRRFNRQPFAQLDAVLYSPLCLALAVGFAVLVTKRL